MLSESPCFRRTLGLWWSEQNPPALAWPGVTPTLSCLRQPRERQMEKEAAGSVTGEVLITLSAPNSDSVILS